MAENNGILAERARVAKPTEEIKDAIRRKSAYSLPNNPSESGYKAEDIRRALYTAIIDERLSLMSELERVVDEINIALDAEAELADVGRSELYGLICDEREERGAADDALNDGVSALAKKIEGESAARISGDTALTEKINAETAARSEASKETRESLERLSGESLKILGTDLYYDRENHVMKILYLDSDGTVRHTEGVDLCLESAIIDVDDRVNEESGIPEIRFVFAKSGEKITSASAWYPLDFMLNFKSLVTSAAMSSALALKQDALPENTGSSSHRMYVAAPRGFKDENGNEVKYYLKRLNTGRGYEGIITKANRDKKLAEGIISAARYEDYVTHGEPTDFSVVIRSESGQIVVEDGAEPFCAVNKRQLDAAFGDTRAALAAVIELQNEYIGGYAEGAE